MSCIVVIGMGRSGTSLLSQILQAKGVWFGNESDLIGQTPINIYGNREHIAIQDINRRLLKEVFGISSWLFQAELEEGWHESSAMFPYNEELLNQIYLLKRSAKDLHYGFKDARVSMLLPLYKDIFNRLKMSLDVKYVVCKRDPKAVYYSLLNARDVLSNFRPGRIDNFNATYLDLYNIWKQYYDNVEKYVKPICTIYYEDWFKDKMQVIQDLELSSTLGLQVNHGMDLIDFDERHF